LKASLSSSSSSFAAEGTTLYYYIVIKSPVTLGNQDLKDSLGAKLKANIVQFILQ
jgi:hypothetical protein